MTQLILRCVCRELMVSNHTLSCLIFGSRVLRGIAPHILSGTLNKVEGCTIYTPSHIKGSRLLLSSQSRYILFGGFISVSIIQTEPYPCQLLNDFSSLQNNECSYLGESSDWFHCLLGYAALFTFNHYTDVCIQVILSSWQLG